MEFCIFITDEIQKKFFYEISQLIYIYEIADLLFA